MTDIKIIATVGPATSTEQDLRKMKERGVGFIRVNLSHSSLEDLAYFINLSKKVEIPFIIDTEGSQIRTGKLTENTITFTENDTVRLYKTEIIGDQEKLTLKPGEVI